MILQTLKSSIITVTISLGLIGTPSCLLYRSRHLPAPAAKLTSDQELLDRFNTGNWEGDARSVHELASKRQSTPQSTSTPLSEARVRTIANEEQKPVNIRLDRLEKQFDELEGKLPSVAREAGETRAPGQRRRSQLAKNPEIKKAINHQEEPNTDK